MNGYARLGDIKADVTGLSAAVAAGSDASYLRDIDDASRAFDADCNGRHFYAYKATRYFRGDGRATLYLPHDLISVATLTVDTDGDGDADLTLVEDTDFWLRPEAASERGNPYWQIDLIPWGTQLSGWPKAERAIAITGLWGWSYELENTGLTATVATTDGTTVTAASSTAASLVYPGDTIVLDDEQMYVSAVVTASITVQRGINGTTGAAHSAKTLYIRRYPRDIEGAIKRRVIAKRWENRSGMPLGEPGKGFDVSYAAYMDVVKTYRNKWSGFGSF
jgi:hypothetical protein